MRLPLSADGGSSVTRTHTFGASAQPVQVFRSPASKAAVEHALPLLKVGLRLDSTAAAATESALWRHHSIIPKRPLLRVLVCPGNLPPDDDAKASQIVTERAAGDAEKLSSANLVSAGILQSARE